MNGPPPTRDAVVEAAKRVAAEAGSLALSRKEFLRRAGLSEGQMLRLFPRGGWREIQELAGLYRHPQDNEALSDDVLLAEFHRVVQELGDVPSWRVFSARATVSADTVRRRFGGLQGTLQRYRAWLERHDPDSPLLVTLGVRSRHEVPAPPTAELAAAAPSAPRSVVQWSRTPSVEYGAPINFRGLRHAPINEQGVVYLFGMVSYELGFLVEAIHTAYPDCEAKRCIDRRRDRWQRVRIEFEYRSRNFLEGGHDPAACDVIVCWEHDWPDCSLEVVELRRVIHNLDA
jgi:hypothetical protein